MRQFDQDETDIDDFVSVLKEHKIRSEFKLQLVVAKKSEEWRQIFEPFEMQLVDLYRSGIDFKIQEDKSHYLYDTFFTASKFLGPRTSSLNFETPPRGTIEPSEMMDTSSDSVLSSDTSITSESNASLSSKISRRPSRSKSKIKELEKVSTMSKEEIQKRCHKKEEEYNTDLINCNNKKLIHRTPIHFINSGFTECKMCSYFEDRVVDQDSTHAFSVVGHNRHCIGKQHIEYWKKVKQFLAGVTKNKQEAKEIELHALTVAEWQQYMRMIELQHQLRETTSSQSTEAQLDHSSIQDNNEEQDTQIASQGRPISSRDST